jgi:hypothetical protein
MFVVGCCASAVNGHATALLLKKPMNSRHLMGFSLAENHRHQSLIRSSNERYAPHRSKRGALMSAMVKSRHDTLKSRYPPKADIGGRQLDVRFVPKADSCTAAILSFFDPLGRADYIR